MAAAGAVRSCYLILNEYIAKGVEIVSREGCEAGIAEGMGKCEAEEFRIISSCQVADLAVHFLAVTPFGLNEPSNEALGG